MDWSQRVLQTNGKLFSNFELPSGRKPKNMETNSEA